MNYQIRRDAYYSTIEAVDYPPDDSSEIFATLGEAKAELLYDLRAQRDEYNDCIFRIKTATVPQLANIKAARAAIKAAAKEEK